MHIRHYLAALKFVNRERRRLDLAALDRLPEGRPGDPHDCVIARTLPGATVARHLQVPGHAARLLPGPVFQFVCEFDFEGSVHGGDPAALVDGGIDDEKGCLVPA
jgi:hypothetical protein